MDLPVLVPTPAELAASAVRRKPAQIDRHAARLQDDHLVHNGRRFYADRGSLETITTTLAVVLMLADDAPVPTPAPVAGKWMSADRDPQTGGRVLVPMSNGQFKQLARALYDHNARLWGAKQVHYATVEAMAAGGATAAEILAYDHLQGWPE